MANIFKRPRAKADLIEIWLYIADDSENRADAFIGTIRKNSRFLLRRLVSGGLERNWVRISGASRLVDTSSIIFQSLVV